MSSVAIITSGKNGVKFCYVVHAALLLRSVEDHKTALFVQHPEAPMGYKDEWSE